LAQVLRHMTAAHTNLIVGTETGDDAAVWRISGDRALVATADFITPIEAYPKLSLKKYSPTAAPPFRRYARETLGPSNGDVAVPNGQFCRTDPPMYVPETADLGFGGSGRGTR
jgi:hypothetical protein